jgi:hypothetical protein
MVQAVVEENSLDTFLIVCLCPLEMVGNLMAELRPVGARTNNVYSGVLHVDQGGVHAPTGHECLGVVAFWRSRNPELAVYSDYGSASKGMFFETSNPDTSELLASTDGLFVDLTQLPMEFCSTLVERFTQPGEIVLDLCGGSGIFTIAALTQGRNAVVFEPVEKKYRSILSSVTKSLATPQISKDNSEDPTDAPVDASQDVNPSQDSHPTTLPEVFILSPHHPNYPIEQEGDPDPSSFACCGETVPSLLYVGFLCVACGAIFHGGLNKIGDTMLCENAPIFYDGDLPFCSKEHLEVNISKTHNPSPFLYFSTTLFSYSYLLQTLFNPLYFSNSHPKPTPAISPNSNILSLHHLSTFFFIFVVITLYPFSCSNHAYNMGYFEVFLCFFWEF